MQDRGHEIVGIGSISQRFPTVAGGLADDLPIRDAAAVEHQRGQAGPVISATVLVDPRRTAHFTNADEQNVVAQPALFTVFNEGRNGVVEGPSEDKESNIDAVLGLGGNTDGEDALYDTAVQVVIKDRKCSTSYIQRKLAIGYNKAARLVEQMEEQGVVSSANHVGKREVLVPEH